jgi:hypothetical protein
MSHSVTESEEARADRSVRVQRFVAGILAVLALGGSLTVLLAQANVTNDVVGATRTCGSAFDAAVDRSGWELWWAADLDESDDQVRSALVRTDLCPSAINWRIGIAATLGSLSVLLAVFVSLRGRTEGGRTEGRRDPVETNVASRIRRLGRATSAVGAALTIGGLVAILVLVADADSTLFLYTDRLVVVVGGLIVLMPAIALFAIGRVLVLVGEYLDRLDKERADAEADA